VSPLLQRPTHKDLLLRQHPHQSLAAQQQFQLALLAAIITRTLMALNIKFTAALTSQAAI